MTLCTTCPPPGRSVRPVNLIRAVPGTTLPQQRLARDLAVLGVPVVLEYRFHPSRQWRWDIALVDQRIALEVDGGIWTQGRHVRGRGFLADREKINTGVILGWRVLEVTPDQATCGHAVDLVRRLLSPEG